MSSDTLEEKIPGINQFPTFSCDVIFTLPKEGGAKAAGAPLMGSGPWSVGLGARILHYVSLGVRA